LKKKIATEDTETKEDKREKCEEEYLKIPLIDLNDKCLFYDFLYYLCDLCG